MNELWGKLWCHTCDGGTLHVISTRSKLIVITSSLSSFALLINNTYIWIYVYWNIDYGRTVARKKFTKLNGKKNSLEWKKRVSLFYSISCSFNFCFVFCFVINLCETRSFCSPFCSHVHLLVLLCIIYW